MRICIYIILVFISLNGFAQTDTVAYSHDYEFKEGIYLTVQQFLHNNPFAKEKIVTLGPKNQLDFFSQLVDQKFIVVKDSAGAEQKVPSATIWGYSQNHTVYLNFNHAFNRLNVIGSFCHFTATVTTTMGYHDPMDYTFGMRNTYEELRQFVFIPAMDKVMDFNVKNMEQLLKSDVELYAQFMKLKNRAKTDSIFIYLRKYNERHPLYLSAK